MGFATLEKAVIFWRDNNMTQTVFVHNQVFVCKQQPATWKFSRTEFWDMMFFCWFEFTGDMPPELQLPINTLQSSWHNRSLEAVCTFFVLEHAESHYETDVNKEIFTWQHKCSRLWSYFSEFVRSHLLLRTSTLCYCFWCFPESCSPWDKVRKKKCWKLFCWMLFWTTWMIERSCQYNAIWWMR